MNSVEPKRVGVVGLGTGTVAAYGREGDEYTYYEIDQLVVDIAEDPELFTFLSESKADVEIVVDDGRHGLDVSDGDLHISNRHFDLGAVVANSAEGAGAEAFLNSYEPTDAEKELGATPSHWVGIPAPGTSPAWLDSGNFVKGEPEGQPWTDDYSNVLSVLKFD